MPYLFSYGTLQKEQVQLKLSDAFCREKRCFIRIQLNMLEITDPEVLRKSGQKYHPVLEFSGNADDEIEGVLFEVTEAEILQADEYEVDDYQRIETVFKSGNKGFIYVGK
jgi:gamma-glutamylcyclotransferase (GGCT)/AIG2-like uncharacterized protein YtfP